MSHTLNASRKVNIVPLPGQTMDDIKQAFKGTIIFTPLSSEHFQSDDRVPDVNVLIDLVVSDGQLIKSISFKLASPVGIATR